MIQLVSNHPNLDILNVVLAPLDRRTESGSGYGFARVGAGEARLTLDVTNIESTTTLDVTIETSADGVSWSTAGTFEQRTGAGGRGHTSKTFELGAASAFARARWTIAGGAGVTFQIFGGLEG